jgi:PTH1 family peptidyl-tRNA hydrolase
MAWLQKRPQVSDNKTFYTLGLNKNLLLIGLGNIGAQFNLTRHNLGFICIDEFVDKTEEMGQWQNRKDFKAWCSEGVMNGSHIIAVKPTTLMNLSGEAVQLLSHYYHIPAKDIVVIHDDLDINFGQIRLRLGGSSGGHNGIKSVSKAIGEDYGRIRIGIGPKMPEQIATEEFVLQKLSQNEQQHLTDLTKEVTSIINEYIFGGSLPSDTRNYII